MKKLTFVIILSLYCSNSTYACSPDGVIKNPSPAPNSWKVLTCKNGKFNGPWYDYTYGKLTAEGNYKDDRPDGSLKVYDSNGNIYMEAKYVDGKQDGISHTYYPGGAVETESYYSDGKMTKFLLYYETGQVKEKDIYDLQGMTKKTFYENGKLKSEEVVASGGIYEKKNYDKNGNLVSTSGN